MLSFVSLESLDSSLLNEICCFRELVSFTTSESLDFVALCEICCFKELPEPFWFLEDSLESLDPDVEFESRLCSLNVAGSRSFSCSSLPIIGFVVKFVPVQKMY